MPSEYASDEKLILEATGMVELILAGLNNRGREPEEALLIIKTAALIVDHALEFMCRDHGDPSVMRVAIEDVAAATERLPALLARCTAQHVEAMVELAKQDGRRAAE